MVDRTKDLFLFESIFLHISKKLEMCKGFKVTEDRLEPLRRYYIKIGLLPPFFL